MSKSYYVYPESKVISNEKAMTLVNNSSYFGVQKGSPAIITIQGPCAVNPSWTIIQDGNVTGTDKFLLTLTSTQRLIVSSYPESQYARIYNQGDSYVDVSQLQDYSKTNFIRVPSGESIALFYVDDKAKVSMTFKEERLLV